MYACACGCIYPRTCVDSMNSYIKLREHKGGKIELKAVHIVLVKIYLFLQIGRELSH